MFREVYQALSRKSWKIKKIDKHYHHGHGPHFAYSIDIAPKNSLFNKYWIHMSNEVAGGGAMLQITSPRGKGYNTEMRNVSMGIAGPSRGYIRIDNIRQEDGGSRNLEIDIYFGSNDNRSEFEEMMDFFSQ
jgi:hypothetical protein